ncbi:MAG: hypothetical protein C0497_05285 [Gemmatimonas sp.]|nr:hypothetical protein [Gemmatimonas sp.]
MFSEIVRRVRARGWRLIVLWGASFVVLIGVVAAVIDLMPGIAITARLSVITMGTSVVIAGCVAWMRERPRAMPIAELLAEEQLGGSQVLISCTADHKHVLEVNSLAACVYPEVKPLSPDLYEQWLSVNPNLLVCLFDRTRKIAGYFDVFPLKTSFMDMLVEGRCGEHDIRREHILGALPARRARRLYLAGIAVSDSCSGAGPLHAYRLIWAMQDYLQHYYAPLEGKLLYAEAASSEGEALLQKFGFLRHSAQLDRRDPFPLYVCAMEQVIANARALIPEWNRERVVLGWRQERSGTRPNRVA